MKHSMKFDGTFFKYSIENVEFLVSPSKATIYLFVSEFTNLQSPLPYADLVETF